MPTTPPITIWKGDGGEITSSDGSVLDTESSLDITTEAGDSLVQEDSTFTPTPQTVWSTNDSQ